MTMHETEAQVQATAEAGQPIEKEEAPKESTASCSTVKHKQTSIRIVELLLCLLCVNMHVKKV